MLLSKNAYVKIAPINANYWKDRGYNIHSTGGRGGKNTGQRIKVSVNDLAEKSNVNVSCRCDICGTKFVQRYSRNKETCYDCRKITQMKGNTHGKANKGKKIEAMTGPNHPRWVKDKKPFATYRYRVQRLTEQNYATYIDEINPNNLPRTLCGVDGGYQLDHIISIKSGFAQNLPIETIASKDNLQMLPWKENREKWHGISTKYNYNTLRS